MRNKAQLLFLLHKIDGTAGVEGQDIACLFVVFAIFELPFMVQAIA